MIPPPKPFTHPGSAYVKDSVSSYKEKFSSFLESQKAGSEAKAEKKRLAARKQAADVYEKRAKERSSGQKGK